jgi:hypothetical protein
LVHGMVMVMVVWVVIKHKIQTNETFIVDELVIIDIHLPS